MRLDLLGIDIFPIGEDDDFLAPPRDEEIAIGIEIAQITGVEPPLAQHLRRGFRTIPISLHYDRASNRNLTRWNRALVYRLRVHNPSLNSRERSSHRTKDNLSRRIDESATRGFGQAVSIQNVDAEGIKIASDRRIKSRTASDQIAHACAEGSMNLSEESLASVDPQSPQRAVERH